MEYPLPKATVQAWEAYRGKTPQNPGLIFDRFIPNVGLAESDKELKKKALRQVAECGKQVDADLLAAWNARWEASVRAANAQPFTLKSEWRFVTGLGRKGPLEIGFTFHRYGVPILPGSSVKGVARAWAFLTLAELLQIDDLGELEKALDPEQDPPFPESFQRAFPAASPEAIQLAGEFRTIFGTRETTGMAIFFDVIPVGTPTLEIDIMNPHFPDYYQDQNGKTPPSDWQSPIPVYFLTVAPNTEFRFAVGWRGTLDENARRLQERAREWLIASLDKLGAGAKTSAGYGRMVTIAAASPGPVRSRNRDASEAKAETVRDPGEEAVASFLRDLDALPMPKVAGQISQFAERWRKLEVGDALKRKVAQAIIDKVRQAGREKKEADKEWYRQLVASLEGQAGVDI